MIAPVAGSGSWPSWIARVSKSIRAMLTPRSCSSVASANDGLCADHAGEPRERSLGCIVEVAAHAGLAVERLHAKRALRPVVLQVGAADEPVAQQQRQDVVAVHALVLALVDLDHVPKAEDALEKRAVPEEVVERREEDRRDRKSVV